MKIPGYIKVQLLLLTTLMISSVSSTVLQIKSTVESTSEESISMPSVPPRERNVKSNKSPTGRSIMDLLQS